MYSEYSVVRFPDTYTFLVTGAKKTFPRHPGYKYKSTNSKNFGTINSKNKKKIENLTLSYQVLMHLYIYSTRYSL